MLASRGHGRASPSRHPRKTQTTHPEVVLADVACATGFVRRDPRLRGCAHANAATGERNPARRRHGDAVEHGARRTQPRPGGHRDGCTARMATGRIACASWLGVVARSVAHYDLPFATCPTRETYRAVNAAAHGTQPRWRTNINAPARLGTLGRAATVLAILLLGTGQAQTNPCDLLMGGSYNAEDGTCYLTWGQNKRETLTVPDGIDTLEVYLRGGNGAIAFANRNNEHRGGYGGRVKGQVSVQPGQEIHVRTGSFSQHPGGSGGGFSGCSKGGDGGGASGLFDGSKDRGNQALLVAGGGGGGAAAIFRHNFAQNGERSFNNKTKISWSRGQSGKSGQSASDWYDATNGGGTGGAPGGAGGYGGTSSSRSTPGQGGGSAYREGRVTNYSFSTRSNFKDVTGNTPYASIRYNAGVSAVHVKRWMGRELSAVQRGFVRL